MVGRAVQGHCTRKRGLEAPSGVEPLHRSFGVRPTTQRPLMIQRDRLRRQNNEIKNFEYFLVTNYDGG